MMDLAAGLQTLVTFFGNVSGIDSASTDASQVTAPGVLVRLASFDVDTLAGVALECEAILVVTDSDGGPGPAAQLSTLYTACQAAGMTADGPVLAQSVQLPTSPAPLPGLIIPITVRIAA